MPTVTSDLHPTQDVCKCSAPAYPLAPQLVTSGRPQLGSYRPPVAMCKRLAVGYFPTWHALSQVPTGGHSTTSCAQHRRARDLSITMHPQLVCSAVQGLRAFTCSADHDPAYIGPSSGCQLPICMYMATVRCHAPAQGREASVGQCPVHTDCQAAA